MATATTFSCVSPRGYKMRGFRRSQRPPVESDDSTLSTLPLDELDEVDDDDRSAAETMRTNRDDGDANVPESRSGDESGAADSFGASATGSARESKVVFREKYQPRHRCPSLNGSLTSIVRPSLYPRSAGVQEPPGIAATSTANPSKHRAFRRKADNKDPPPSSSSSSLRFFARSRPREIKKLKNLIDIFNTAADAAAPPTSGSNNKNKCEVDISPLSLSTSTHSSASDQGLVRTPCVGFNNSMEVYVFDA